MLFYLLLLRRRSFYAGDEWGADKGRVVVVVPALYGLKSSALQFRNHLAATLGNKLGFKSCLADPDVTLQEQAQGEWFGIQQETL